MYIELIAELLLAVFAVFGLYAMIRLFVTSRLSPARMGVVIEIRRGTESEDVPLLLDRARDSMFLCGTGRIVALVDHELSENTALLDALHNGGAGFYFVKFD